MGKTELIKQFIKNKQGIYFLADKRTEIEQLKELSDIITVWNFGMRPSGRTINNQRNKMRNGLPSN